MLQCLPDLLSGGSTRADKNAVLDSSPAGFSDLAGGQSFMTMVNAATKRLAGPSDQAVSLSKCMEIQVKLLALNLSYWQVDGDIFTG